MDYKRFFSEASNNLVEENAQQIGVRINALEVAGKGPIAELSRGLPHEDLFPITDLSFTLSNGKNVRLAASELQMAQQYSLTPGLPPCRDMCRRLVSEFHSPPLWGALPTEGGTDVVVSPGNMNANFSMLYLLLNPGDHVITDRYQYAGITAQMTGLNVRPLTVDVDADGIIPDSVRRVLARWRPEDADDPKSDIPRLLMTVPNHSNPTGSVLSEERKRDIYSIAQKYNLLIFEDDCYFFVNFDDKDVPPSFLSMDTDGRVLRADSFSKLFAPGYRLGFISGPAPVLEKYVHLQMIITVGASSMSQVLVTRIVKEFGFDGFKTEIRKMNAFYRERRDIMLHELNKHVTGLATWDVPKGGYFFWLKMPKLKIQTNDLLELLLKKKVAIIPGTYFLPGGTSEEVPTIRLSFSKPSIDDIREGVRVIATLLKENVRM